MYDRMKIKLDILCLLVKMLPNLKIIAHLYSFIILIYIHEIRNGIRVNKNEATTKI